MRHYDLCVIGSGPAGQRAAIQAAKLGKSAVVIEKGRELGGVAVNTGTIPSKALREAILQVAGKSVATPTTRDFAQARDALFSNLIRACQRVIAAEVNITQDQFRRNHIQAIHGTASFQDEHCVTVTHERGSDRVTADHFLIAVGTRPARPDNIPFDDHNIITSDQIHDLPDAPHSMIVVGGGVIGTEYASMLQALGVKTTIIEGRDRLLDFIDAELAEALQFHLRQAGATLRLGERVTKINKIEAIQGARTSDNIMAEAVLESGKTIRADALLYAVGRQGNTEALDLHNAGLKADNRGRIPVNAHFQTAKAHIYAAGDVIGFPALASTSYEQGRVAACHMFGQRFEAVADLLPYGIYAVPEISMVGWTERQLTEAGIPYESGVASYKEIARGQLLGDDIGMLKLLIHQDSHTVLGVHALGTGATELIHIGQAAIAFKATAEYFVDTVFNYPTLAEAYKVAAYNALNKLKGV